MGKVLICGKEMLVKNEVLSPGEYHRYWLDHAKRLKNPGFDEFSSKVLDIKEGKPAAIRNIPPRPPATASPPLPASMTGTRPSN